TCLTFKRISELKPPVPRHFHSSSIDGQSTSETRPTMGYHPFLRRDYANSANLPVQVRNLLVGSVKALKKHTKLSHIRTRRSFFRWSAPALSGRWMWQPSCLLLIKADLSPAAPEIIGL